MICLTLSESSTERALRRVVDYQKYIDLCELRIDYLSTPNPVAIAQFPASLADARCQAKSILTFRRQIDGGRYQGSDQERLRMLKRILTQKDAITPFQYLDLELDIRDHKYEREVCALAQERGITVIRSVHDFSSTVTDILPLLQATTADRNEIGKVAVAADSLATVCQVIEQLKAFRASKEHRHARLIVIAMGEYGQLLRILARRFGIYCTYCSAPHTKSVAPGQLDPVALADMYRYHRIDKHTKIFAVVGNPIAHSKSPQFHNNIFSTQRKNACYIPIKCDNLQALHRLSLLLPLSGLSVTLPHKSDIIRYTSRIDRDARMIGSCNTIIIKDSKWHGYNTDLFGFEQPLRDCGLLQKGRAEEGKALVIGAGGVSRTACFSLLRHGYGICILNRSSKRAQALADELRNCYPNADIQTLPLSARSLPSMSSYTTLIVQTTSVGMHPQEADDPISFYAFSGREVVYDLIYNPAHTALLKRAEQAGCRTISGQGMFAAQAQKQSAYFLKRATR